MQISQQPKEVADKLFQYLFQVGKGIEYFDLKGKFEGKHTESENSQADFYQRRHRWIKREIQKRLSEHGENQKISDIQYFLSKSNGKQYVWFLSPNRNHSGWKELFEKYPRSRERILNLVFKFYIILSQGLPVESMTGFEELLLIHSIKPGKKDALLVWGQNLFVEYNRYGVLSLTLSRKYRRFLQQDQYRSVDGDDLGEVLIYADKTYYYERDLDARRKNSIYFMRFDRDYDEFRKTQVYHYQNLMSKLENFLKECQISFSSLHFQADHYLENAFISKIESVESLEIINNTGVDLAESDKQFLERLLNNQGISLLTFYSSGKTVSTYEKVEVEGRTNLVGILPKSFLG